MQSLTQALGELRTLHERILGTPAPEISPASYVPFPPGVDPVAYALEEARQVKRLAELRELAPQPVAWIPPADVWVGEREAVVRVDLPGVERDRISVLLIGEQLVVRGDRKRGLDREGELRPVGLERPAGRFERRFVLPAGVRPDQIQARYHQGVLEIRVPLHAGETLGGEHKIEVA